MPTREQVERGAELVAAARARLAARWRSLRAARLFRGTSQAVHARLGRKPRAHRDARRPRAAVPGRGRRSRRCVSNVRVRRCATPGIRFATRSRAIAGPRGCPSRAARATARTRLGRLPLPSVLADRRRRGDRPSLRAQPAPRSRHRVPRRARWFREAWFRAAPIPLCGDRSRPRLGRGRRRAAMELRLRELRAARAGERPRRSQSSFAVSADGERWWLVNVSPDIAQQIEAAPAAAAARRARHADRRHAVHRRERRPPRRPRRPAPAGRPRVRPPFERGRARARAATTKFFALRRVTAPLGGAGVGRRHLARRRGLRFGSSPSTARRRGTPGARRARTRSSAMRSRIRRAEPARCSRRCSRASASRCSPRPRRRPGLLRRFVLVRRRTRIGRRREGRARARARADFWPRRLARRARRHSWARAALLRPPQQHEPLARPALARVRRSCKARIWGRRRWSGVPALRTPEWYERGGCRHEPR
jgi:hypothetical protein